MTVHRTVIASLIASLAASVAAGQTPAGESGQTPGSKVIERTYDNGPTPWRVVSTRSTAGIREVTIDVVESPNVDGRMSPIQETVTETTRSGATSETTKQDVFVVRPDGRRMLFETTESQRDTQANGDVSVSHNTFTYDLNGGNRLSERIVEETRPVGTDGRQVTTTRLVPHPNGALREATRTEESERRVSPQVVRAEGTALVRDVNGRWRPIETREREVQEGAQRFEEETVQRVDINGRVTPVERIMSRATATDDREDVVIETHASFIDRLPGSGSDLALSERLTRTTTMRADGGSDTVEEVEGRNPAAPADPLRVVRRVVTTVRPSASGRWTTEREVVERDVNGRMRRVSLETEDSPER